MTRRIGAIILALVLAGLGTAGVLFYALTADKRAREAIGDPVTVAVADKRIAAGTSGVRIRNEKLVRFVTMPSTSVPDDVLKGIGADLNSLVVTSNIAEGQLLLRANFGQSTSVSSGLPLPGDKMAITVQTGAPEQVAGYVRPGSQVAIFLTYQVRDTAGKLTGTQRTRVLLPRVDVLAIGTYQPDGAATTSGAGRSSGASLLITVAVTQPEAERLVQGKSSGSLYLALLTDATSVKAGEGVENTDATDNAEPLFR